MRKPSKALTELLTRLVDGDLDDREAVALELLLQQDPAARVHYRLFLAVHLGLQETFQADANIAPLPVPRENQTRWHWLGLAAALVITAGLVVWGIGRRPTVPQTAGAKDTPTEAQPVLAVVASAQGAAWNLGAAAEPGRRLTAGPLCLHAGELVLTLVNGQTLAVRAPAELELINERELRLLSGSVSLHDEDNHGLLVVRLRKGAVVGSASEFALTTRPDGGADLRVFEGEVSASTVDANGRSREEAVVDTGMTLEIGDRLRASTFPATAFFRAPRPLVATESIADEIYAAAVVADHPAAYWRFEETTAGQQVPDLAGGHGLDLIEDAVLSGSPGRRFLAVDDRQHSGFAYGREPITGLTGAGFTLECLFYSASVRHSTALALEWTSAFEPASGPIHHAPQLCAIERMGRMGEIIGHIHPDYALRAVARFPAGYEGGTNLYSDKSHLLHAWHHAALTFDGTTLRLYLDGRLSDEAIAAFAWGTAGVRPVIGRLQPDPRDELRQWVGGIDEVAIYLRPLDGAAVLRHHLALRTR